MKTPPVVALVSRSNARGGGASRIAEELGQWLCDAGSRVVHYCAFPIGNLKSFQEQLFPAGILGKLSRTTHRVTRSLGLREIFPCEFYTTLRKVVQNFDLVHFHDLNTAVSPLTMRFCARRKPVVFTAHDCSCFTGGSTAG